MIDKTYIIHTSPECYAIIYTACGKMIMLYHGLDIAVKNKWTDDITAYKERHISLIVNKKVLDSNQYRKKP